MASKIFTLGCVSYNSTQFNQIENASVDPGIQRFIGIFDGNVDPTYATVLQQNPRFTFATSAIARAFGICGPGGVAFATALVMYYRNLVQCTATYDVDACAAVTANYGLLALQNIDADQNGARANYEVVARSNDGLTAPIAVGIAATMPALTAADQYFVAGPASINGVALDSVESTRVDFGNDIRVVSDSGRAFPSFIWYRRQPTVTFRTHDLGILNTLGVSGVAQGTSDSTFYLRKCLQDGTRVIDATAEHIKFSVDAGHIAAGVLGGGDQPMAEITISPTWDGTNDILAMSIAAIT